MGLTIGGFGVTAAGYEKLVPYIAQPDDIIPGESTWFATSCRECPAGCAMVVRNRDAHAVKCEGNSGHPINRGRLCSRGQAALHGLYDPDRIRGPMRRKASGDFEKVSWDAAMNAAGKMLAGRPRTALITDLQAGSLETLMRAWLGAVGSGTYIVYEPIDYEAVRAANGGIVPRFNIAGADHLISFGADFLETWISPVEYAVQFARMRQVKNATRARFVYVGPRVSMTAANADVRIIVPPGAEAEIARAIAVEAGIGRRAPGPATQAVYKKYSIDPAVVRNVAAGLARAKAPLSLPGGDAITARAAMALNTGKSAALIDTAHPHAVSGISTYAEMTGMISAMEAGTVDVVVVFGANPVYGLPDSARFVDALKRVPHVISLSSFMDETSTHASLILPSNTPLESWGDYAPYPDVRNILQPTMGAVFDTRQTGDILMGLARRAGADMAALGTTTFYSYVRRQWGVPATPGADDRAWESMVQMGGKWPGETAVPPTPPTGYETRPEAGFTAVPVVLTAAPIPAAAPLVRPPTAPAPPTSETGAGRMMLWPYPHTHFYDGRGANRRWLQEMPEPVTDCVWGTWAEINPVTAGRLGVSQDDVVEIDYGGAHIRVPAFVWEGVPPDTVAVPIGEGHTAYGRYAKDLGQNVLKLAGARAVPVNVSNTGESIWAARIKSDTGECGRAIAQVVTLGEHFAREEPIRMPLPSGYGRTDFQPGHSHVGHRWAMVVDMDRCIGCNACVTACYAENNVGVVGPDNIRRRREMAWVRIDRYIDWGRKSAPIVFQPMLCQHCDAAPCEPVCPVFAAYHTQDGINAQIYNRCVGTRYCSNNCPYKVRRFNWFDYDWPKPMNYQLNPDVTVRSRGVMEKCTFCIQRIREAGIVARRQKRTIADGEITPACAGTCPTGAYTFGDLKDPNSRVSKIIRTDPRAYQVLGHLNTKPAVIYLKRIVEI